MSGDLEFDQFFSLPGLFLSFAFDGCVVFSSLSLSRSGLIKQSINHT